MTSKIFAPLTLAQKIILTEFYLAPFARVVFNKTERKKIWDDFKETRQIPSLNLATICPALLMELQKSSQSGKNVQSAVFSECVYAQTLAIMLNLTEFCSYPTPNAPLNTLIENKIAAHNLKPRYVYYSLDGKVVLVQAGGFGGVDAALIIPQISTPILIEFKEPGAKISEPDLPLYKEDGFLVSTQKFLQAYSHFEGMINYQLEKKMNFWDAMGSNVNDFDEKSVQEAISKNYATTKLADVICVEDANGYLTMLPADHVAAWADTRGEIRPAGRNPRKVWTPEALEKFIIALGGRVDDGVVVIPVGILGTATARGGSKKVSRLKINPLFFVYATDVEIVSGLAYFNLNKVRQLKPTISAHMFFRELQVAEVSDFYRLEI